MSTLRSLAHRVALPALLATSAAALTSCAVGPDYRRPTVSEPTAFKRADAPPAAAPTLASNWWTLFNDPELTRLIEATLGANLDLQAAMARVDQARAATRGTRSSLFPTLDLSPSARRSRSNGGTGTGGRTTNSFSLPVDLGYELDIWGRVRRQVESARASERVTTDDYAVVMQTVLSDVAQGYFNLRLYDAQAVVLEKNLDLFRRQLDLTQTKFNAGLSLQTDILQARTQVDSANNQLLEVRRSRAKEEHALAILTGRAPSDFILERGPLTTTVPLIPAGLPPALLSRRPDVASAEQQLIAANANIGVAKANFYPSLNLTGSAGFESLDLSTLTDWPNRVWSAGAGLTLPLFQGGRLTAQLAQVRARYEELVASYRSTVLNAYRDVEDNLSDLRILSEEAALLDQTLVSSREYARLTELQYRQGITSYLQVIDANQTLLTNELSTAQTQARRLAASVLLIKALGGGWDPAAPLPEKMAAK